MKVYAKDSMDRFGDDLTEEILQYMTLEDKIKLECVSKQWKRCVFQRQFVIEMNWYSSRRHNLLNKLADNRTVDEKALESVLKKCQNIMSVRLGMTIESEVLALFGRYCPRLKFSNQIDYGFEHPRGFQFLRIYGHKLEQNLITVANKDFLKLCPNLRSVDVSDISLLLDESQEFLPKIEQILVIQYFITPEEVKEINILVHKYRQSLKTLDLDIGGFNEEELKSFIECISRFENLQSLTLDFDLMKTTEPIDDCLSLIGQKCNKLLNLYLRIDESVPISEQFFDVFTHFKAIKKLKLYLQPNRVLKRNVESFKHCTELYELNISYPELREDFFTNIDSFVPKLQSFRIQSGNQFLNTFINSFHSMKFIQKVVHIVVNETNEVLVFRQNIVRSEGES